VEKRTQFNVWYFVLAFAGVLLLQALWGQFQRIEPLPYSEFVRQLESGNVAEVAVSDRVIRGSLKTAMPSGRSEFQTTRVDPEFAERLGQAGVVFRGEIESTFWRDLLSWIVPVVFFVGVWFFVFRRFADRQGLGGMMSVGKSRAKVFMEREVKVTFDDVAGVDEAKKELKEVVAFLREPSVYGRLGARIAKGILLVGPPGTGKTLLARAVAGQAGVPFFSINGSEFVELFVGVGAARVRDLFDQARQHAPCIVFIDELDALGRARGLSWGGGHDEKEQTLNQLLAELDGFDPSTGVVLLAATNRPEILDPALLRAGRFDRQVLLDRPDRKGRIDILEVHLKKVAASAAVDMAEVAALTPGFTGADLANLVNEAAVVATRRNAAQVEMADFTAAIERIVAGLEKRNRILTPLERETVAVHEMGHAIVALSSPGADVVHKVSVIPRGIGALGYTIQRPTEDRHLMTEGELRIKLAVLLAGRAAEQLVFKRLSTGGADDMAKATNIARGMVMRYGMNAILGPVTYDEETTPFLGDLGALAQRPRNFSEDTAKSIDEAVRTVVNDALDQATRALVARRTLLDAGVKLLLERETLLENDLAQLLTRYPATSASDPTGRAAS